MKTRGFLKFTFLMLLPGLFFSSEAQAFKKVYSPIVQKGELEFESQSAVDFDKRHGFDDAQEQKFAVAYGLTDWWATEVYAELGKEAREDQEEGTDNTRPFKYTATSWENRFQLTEQGRYWLDLGFYLEYAWARQRKNPDELEVKILLEKEEGDFIHRFNLILTKEIGGTETADWEPGFAWQTLYRLRAEFQPGFEIHSNFGPVREQGSFQQQEHFIGPVAEGRIFKSFKYNVGYLFGITDNTPGGQLKFIVEWERYF